MFQILEAIDSFTGGGVVMDLACWPIAVKCSGALGH